LDEIGCDEPLEPALTSVGVSRDGAQQDLVELGPDDRGVLQQAPGSGGQPVDAGEEQPLQSGRHVHRLAGRQARPGIALTGEYALPHQAPDDLLDEERIAPGPAGNEVLQIRRLPVLTVSPVTS
jgi:hypothetical protein